MRAICCSCGQLVAPDDEELFRVYLNHMRAQHSDIQLTDLQFHTVLLYAAHDVDVSNASDNSRPMAGVRAGARLPRPAYEQWEEER
jgi:hypothetical protein